MSILVEIMDSRLESSDETISFRKQSNYTNLFVRLEQGKSFAEILYFCFFYGKSTKCEEKLRHFQLF